MAVTAFDRAFEILIGHEGGFGKDPRDPGNWTGRACGVGELRGTKYGISAGSYPDEDIENLTLDRAKGIYKRDYWDRVRGDDLPPPLALLVFDAAVNNGVGRAARWLQEVAGAQVDGIVGPATLRAVQATAAKSGVAICAEYLAVRLAFMASLPGWRTFGRGWSRRLCRLPYQSLTMLEA